MTTIHRIPESSAPFLLRDTHGARNSGIFGVDVVLEPAKRNASNSHNASKRDAFEQQLVNCLFGVVADTALRGIGYKLTTARLALPFRFPVMNRTVFDELCSLALRTLHGSTPCQQDA